MNQLFLTLRAKRIMFSYKSKDGTVTEIKNITLTKEGNRHIANGRYISKNLYNELQKLN